jgi:hypothetical protein
MIDSTEDEGASNEDVFVGALPCLDLCKLETVMPAFGKMNIAVLRIIMEVLESYEKTQGESILSVTFKIPMFRFLLNDYLERFTAFRIGIESDIDSAIDNETAMSIASGDSLLENVSEGYQKQRENLFYFLGKYFDPQFLMIKNIFSRLQVVEQRYEEEEKKKTSQK